MKKSKITLKRTNIYLHQQQINAVNKLSDESGVLFF